ncbi:MAG: protease TldD [Methanomassiliicoccales archaeon PtaU1.Bin124]|nr:MAG: protease TldD [Methanomassiliicoccales archaeon PtaU1.Bin124]
MEDILEYVVQLALKEGATYAEARYQADRSESILLKNGLPEVTSFDTKRGIGIRIIAKGGLAFSATNLLNKGTLSTMVKRAVRSAVASRWLRKGGVRLSEADIVSGRFETKQRIGFGNVPMELRAELLKEADDLAIEAGRMNRVSVPGRFLSLDTWETEKTIITSDGGHVTTSVPRVAFTAFITAAVDGNGSEQRIIQLGESGGWECAERWDLPLRIKEEVGTLAMVLQRSKHLPAERMDVILGPEVVGIVSHESCGHPGEADRLLGREAAQAGDTFLTRSSLGSKAASGVVNVVDDPTLPRSFGYYACDDECVKARRRFLIKEGRFSEFLQDRETAADLDVRSNGSSRSVAYNREPIVRMANTFVQQGDHRFEELVEGVKRGVYIKNYTEWNIDDRRYNQRYVGLEAYLIESGQIRHAVRNPLLEVTTPALWSSIDAVGKDLEFSAAYCGKGDPMQGIPVWAGGPHIRLRNMHVGGGA